MSTRVLRGHAALARVNSADFIHQWTALWSACPWATSMQSPAFVRLWYRLYGARYEAVLVEQCASDGSLAAVLTLAIVPGTRQLTGAGAEQAEYQAWLSRGEGANETFVAMLAALQRSFPGYSLVFPYLAPRAPLAWQQNPACPVTESRTDVRGLMPLGDGSGFDGSLRKKSNRSRLNRLEKVGPVSLKHVTDPPELDRVLDEVAALYDLRQGALNGITPFRSDPLKREFHLELLREAGLLHATLLMAGDRIASAHLDMANRDEVLLCVIAHAPGLARHSPGKFHILLLGQAMAKEGTRAFDLSPGGEYKERFATASEPVSSVRIYFGAGAATAFRIRRWLRCAVQRSGLSADRVRAWRDATVALLAGRTLRRAIRHARRSRLEDVVVFAHRHGGPAAATTCEVNRDSVATIVGPMADRPPFGQEPQQVLRQALDRLEEGDHVFTVAGPQGLRGSGWLAAREEALILGGAAIEFTPPPHSAVLYDLWWSDAATSPEGLVRAMIADARAQNDDSPLVALACRGTRFLEALLSLGFEEAPELRARLRPTGRAAAPAAAPTEGATE